MYSWSEAPSWPPAQRNTFLSVTMAMITRMTLRSDPIGSPGTRNGPTSTSWMLLSHPMSAPIASGWSNSVLRNGISSVNAMPSSAAAVTLQTMFPASRQLCGRRKRSRRL